MTNRFRRMRGSYREEGDRSKFKSKATCGRLASDQLDQHQANGFAISTCRQGNVSTVRKMWNYQKGWMRGWGEGILGKQVREKKRKKKADSQWEITQQICGNVLTNHCGFQLLYSSYIQGSDVSPSN